MSRLPRELQRNHVLSSSTRHDVNQLRLLSHHWNNEIVSFDPTINKTIKWLHISNLITNISELGPDALFKVYQLELALRQIKNDLKLFNATKKEDMIMIEKLLYQILINDNLELREFRELLSETIIDELGLQRRLKDYPQMNLMQRIVSTTFISLPTTKTKNRGYIRAQIYQYATNLYEMLKFAATEMRRSSIKYNRYTKFALYYLDWIIRFINEHPGSDSNVAVCSLWDSLVDIEFITDFLDSQITKFRLDYCGVFLYSVHGLILKDVFGNTTHYKPQSLDLFLLKDKYLWIYEDVTVQYFMHYCNSQTLPIWIRFLLENKLRSAMELYDEYMDYGSGAAAVLIRHLARFLRDNATIVVNSRNGYVTI